MVLNCCDVVIVCDVNDLQIVGVQDVKVGEVVSKLIPLDEVILEEVGVIDVDNAVSPFDVMRLAGSIS